MLKFNKKALEKLAKHNPNTPFGVISSALLALWCKVCNSSGGEPVVDTDTDIHLLAGNYSVVINPDTGVPEVTLPTVDINGDPAGDAVIDLSNFIIVSADSDPEANIITVGSDGGAYLSCDGVLSCINIQDATGTGTADDPFVLLCCVGEQQEASADPTTWTLASDPIQFSYVYNANGDLIGYVSQAGAHPIVPPTLDGNTTVDSTTVGSPVPAAPAATPTNPPPAGDLTDGDKHIEPYNNGLVYYCWDGAAWVGPIVQEFNFTVTDDGDFVVAQSATEPCENEGVHTQSDGTANDPFALAKSNEVVLDPSSTEHDTNTPAGTKYVGHGFEGENPTANNGVYLPAEGGEVRGTQAGFLKVIETVLNCVRRTVIVWGLQVANTAFIDPKFYSDDPRTERRDHPFRDAGVMGNVNQLRQVVAYLGGTHVPDSVYNSSLHHVLDMSQLHTHEGQILLTGGDWNIEGRTDFGNIRMFSGNSIQGNLGDNLDATQRFPVRITADSISLTVKDITGTPDNSFNTFNDFDSCTLRANNAACGAFGWNFNARNKTDSTLNAYAAKFQQLVPNTASGLIAAGSRVSQVHQWRVESPWFLGRDHAFVNYQCQLGDSGIVDGEYAFADTTARESNGGNPNLGRGVVDIDASNNTAYMTNEISVIENGVDRQGPVLGANNNGTHTVRGSHLIQRDPTGVYSAFYSAGTAGGQDYQVYEGTNAYFANTAGPLFYSPSGTSRNYIHGELRTNSLTLDAGTGTRIFNTGTILLNEDVYDRT